MAAATSAAITEVEVRAMSTAEVRVNLERCTRLVAHPALLQRLPDGGENIRHRHALFTAELARREQEQTEARTTAAASAASVAAPSTPEEAKRRENESAFMPGAAMSPAEVARQMGDKYRDQRVPVEATVRRMYEGAISESEIQRILRDVPEKFFLTYAETCEMEKKLAKDARLAELQRLAAESKKQSLPPQ